MKAQDANERALFKNAFAPCSTSVKITGQEEDDETASDLWTDGNEDTRDDKRDGSRRTVAVPPTCVVASASKNKNSTARAV